jgi:PKD domain
MTRSAPGGDTASRPAKRSPGRGARGVAGPVLVLTGLIVALVPASALGALGEQLTWFVPQPGSASGGGRGIAISGSTAYISSASEPIYVVDLATHQTTGSLETRGRVPGGFGALTADPSGQLWGSEYEEEGWIDKINGAEAVERVFNAKAFDENNTGIDGLSADSDGTLWLKGEGIGASERTIYHLKPNGEQLGYCIVHFEASGMAVEGTHIWLASVGGHRIYEYEKKTTGGACVPVEVEHAPVSFSTGNANSEEVSPEGLALDHCTFPGRLALWTFGAAFVSGPLVAYDLGPSTDTEGCPPPPKKEEPAKSSPKESSPTTSGAGSTSSGKVPGIYVGGVGGSAIAGGSTLLEDILVGDPTGLLFRYIWIFGDGSQLTGNGRVHHLYKCAGIYRLTVTDIDTSGARHVRTGELAVGFPRSATRSYRGLRFGPHVRISGHTAMVWLSVSGRGHDVHASSIDWTFDRHHAKHFSIHNRAQGSISLHRDHGLVSSVHFSNQHTTTIHTCFYA